MRHRCRRGAPPARAAQVRPEPLLRSFVPGAGVRAAAGARAGPRLARAPLVAPVWLEVGVAPVGQFQVAEWPPASQKSDPPRQ
jgi:hypothetical protein